MDDKSSGFQLESSLIRSADALTRLGFVLAITTLYLVAQGTEVVKQGKRRWVDAHWFRGHSYLKIGWNWIRSALSKGWELLTRLRLNGGPILIRPEPRTNSMSETRILHSKSNLSTTPRHSFVSQAANDTQIKNWCQRERIEYWDLPGLLRALWRINVVPRELVPRQ